MLGPRLPRPEAPRAAARGNEVAVAQDLPRPPRPAGGPGSEESVEMRSRVVKEQSRELDNLRWGEIPKLVASESFAPIDFRDSAGREKFAIGPSVLKFSKG